MYIPYIGDSVIAGVDVANVVVPLSDPQGRECKRKTAKPHVLIARLTIPIQMKFNTTPAVT